MPSDGDRALELPADRPPPPAPARLAWLRSQGLGLVCGGLTIALLAVGSVVIAATRDGASAGIHMDDLRGFFDPPRAAHAWLYLLFPVAALYGVNTVLATWDTVARKWRLGVRAPAAYAASIVHVGFLLALFAHAVGGFLGEDGDGVLVASGWQEVPGFGEARLVSLDVDALPGGMPRSAEARLQVRDPSGLVREETVGYNAPLSSGGGARLALLADLGGTFVARLGTGGEACVLAEGQACRVGGGSLRLLGFAPGQGGAPGAVVRFTPPRVPADGVERGGSSGEVRVLARGVEVVLSGGAVLRLDAIAREPAIVLRTRSAPGNPWALGASLLMAAGVALLWRKLAR
jgi:hypothetical protein